MAALPANVKTAILSISSVAHSKHLTSVKANIASASNIVRHSAARQQDEPSPQQARTIDKILRLPK